MDIRASHATRRVTVPVVHPLEASSPLSILLVTPDAELRDAVARALEAEGFVVQSAPHSGHAQLACLSGPRVDVLVADLSMDEMSGPSLAERLRRHRPLLQAVYLGHPGAPPCERLLVRPFTRDELVSAVQRAAHDARQGG